MVELENEIVIDQVGPAKRVLARFRTEAAAISIITLGELADGFTEAAEFVRFMSPYRVVQLSTAIAWRMAQLQNRATHRLGENDAWIAATALTYNATLVGRDRAFTRVPRLQYLAF